MNNYSIYPKQFKDIKQKIDEKTCFIIMPFKRTNVYEIIKRAIEFCGLNYDRSDELKKSSPFMNKIISSIGSAYHLIVDISDQNANVLYELGIAHTLRDADRVLILKDKETECPSDLKFINYFSYSESNPMELYDHVVSYLKNNSCINDLKEIMVLLNLINNDKHLTETLENIQNKLGNHCVSLIYLLNNLIDKVENFETNQILMHLYELMLSKIDENSSISETCLKIITLLIRKLSPNFDLELFLLKVFSEKTIDEDFLLNAKIEIAVEFLNYEKKNSELFKWIKFFLVKSSPASVDIARYKLHVGIINSKSSITKDFLLSVLEDDSDNTLLEHALNLSKAKFLKESVTLAIKILKLTENPFVFRSAMDLITDCGSINQINDMFKVITKKSKIIKENSFIDIHIDKAKARKDKLQIM